MFGKSSEPSSEQESSRPLGTNVISTQSVPVTPGQKDKGVSMDKATTVIAQGATFKGTLKSDDSVQIDGNFEGELDVKQTVHIGTSAVIKANIKAGEVKISGRVDGNIEAKERMEILSSGKLFGDIKTPRLIIAEGVVFEGHCTMGTEKRPESLVSAQASKPSVATPVGSGASTIR